MIQLKTILKRLQNPSVLISIVSQVITILMLYNIRVDMDLVTATITGICSILVLLGIMSDPNTQNKGYGDDYGECSGCHKISQYVMINGNTVCKECGCINCITEQKVKE